MVRGAFFIWRKINTSDAGCLVCGAGGCQTFICFLIYCLSHFQISGLIGCLLPLLLDKVHQIICTCREENVVLCKPNIIGC